MTELSQRRRKQQELMELLRNSLHEVFDVDSELEWRFHGTRRWRFDLAIPSMSIALEVEGGVWTGGRHTNPSGFLGDIEKYNEATLLGWMVLRCTWKEVRNGEAQLLLERAIKYRTGYADGR